MKGKTKIKIFVALDGERSEKRDTLQKTLKTSRLQYKNVYVSGHSEEATEITGKNIVLIYKNKKGGMTETTLNHYNNSVVSLYRIFANKNRRNRSRKILQQNFRK